METTPSDDLHGADSSAVDIADARAYIDRGISAQEYVARTRSRYDVSAELGESSGDPVGVFDAMWEAGTSLFGSYVWLMDHAETEEVGELWWALAVGVKRERADVDARDMRAQRVAMLGFISRERSVRDLVRA